MQGMTLTTKGRKGPCSGTGVGLARPSAHTPFLRFDLPRRVKSFVKRQDSSVGDGLLQRNCDAHSRGRLASRRPCEGWWARRDLNSQALRHKILSLACLPISPLARKSNHETSNPKFETNSNLKYQLLQFVSNYDAALPTIRFFASLRMTSSAVTTTGLEYCHSEPRTAGAKNLVS